MRKKGTKEWAKNSYNIQYDCPNKCLYCYARKMAKRFTFKDKTIDDADKIKKLKGMIMFPTMHDITTDNIINYETHLLKHLEVGNDVLIVSKAYPTIFSRLFVLCEKYKNQIEFRFSITSSDYKISLEYETNAPIPIHRLWNVAESYKQGYKTSVSIEPMLELPYEIVDRFSRFNIYIWIGCATNYSDNYLKKLYKKENLLQIYNLYKDNPKIKFKDSFMKKIKIDDLTNG